MRRCPQKIKPSVFLTVVTIGCLVLTGCATVRYTPYSKTETFTPKSKHYTPIAFPVSPEELTNRQYRMIGKLEITGYSSYLYTTSQGGMFLQFFNEAQRRGAEGVANLTINQMPYQAELYIPGYTTYESVTTQTQGTTHASAFGSGGYAYGSGSYSGTSTTNVPVQTPGQTIPYTGVVNSMAGDLIVLLDKDTFGDLGIRFDFFARNIPGLLVQQVYDHGAAEKAALVPGDIIISIGGVTVTSIAEFNAKVKPRVGEPIQVAFIRSGKSSTITLVPQRGNYE